MVNKHPALKFLLVDKLLKQFDYMLDYYIKCKFNIIIGNV